MLLDILRGLKTTLPKYLLGKSPKITRLLGNKNTPNLRIKAAKKRVFIIY
jgi:hypothetical protein